MGWRPRGESPGAVSLVWRGARGCRDRSSHNPTSGPPPTAATPDTRRAERLNADFAAPRAVRGRIHGAIFAGLAGSTPTSHPRGFHDPVEDASNSRLSAGTGRRAA